jgi:hypothetical protein
MQTYCTLCRLPCGKLNTLHNVGYGLSYRSYVTTASDCCDAPTTIELAAERYDQSLLESENQYAFNRANLHTMQTNKVA